MLLSKKRVRWGAILLLLVGVAILLPECVSLRMSDKAIAEYFNDAPVKPSFHTLQTNGRLVHYAMINSLRTGTDSLPVVVFVHGSPGSWDAFIAFFKDSSLYSRARLISVDRPGFGKSGLGVPETSLKKQASAVAAVIEEVTPSGRAVLVGHSLGGPVVARLAIDYPNRVSGLILVAPSIDPALEKQEWYRPALASFPIRYLLPKELDVSNREIKPLKGELMNMMPLWASINVPVTVIQGDQDELVPPGNAEFAKHMLTHALVSIQMLPGMNHFIPWRRADTIHDAILNYLPAQTAGR